MENQTKPGDIASFASRAFMYAKHEMKEEGGIELIMIGENDGGQSFPVHIENAEHEKIIDIANDMFMAFDVKKYAVITELTINRYEADDQDVEEDEEPSETLDVLVVISVDYDHRHDQYFLLERAELGYVTAYKPFQPEEEDIDSMEFLDIYLNCLPDPGTDQEAKLAAFRRLTRKGFFIDRQETCH